MPPGSDVTNEFRSYPLSADGDPFAELLASIRFEDLGKGRQGGVLVRADATGGVPIVRTTTRYVAPVQRFRPVHERLAQRIRERAALPVGFNNALVERYTNAYATMGSHSDQALDLADESFIVLFSCYERPGTADPPRKLIVESKAPGGPATAIPLDHNGVVAFSVGANRRFRHKIVLDASAGVPENPWLGVTFRTSKTVVRFRDGRPYFPDGTLLTLADDEQAREFYRLRRGENGEADFVYPLLTYTISASDLLPPEPVPVDRG